MEFLPDVKTDDVHVKCNTDEVDKFDPLASMVAAASNIAKGTLDSAKGIQPGNKAHELKSPSGSSKSGNPEAGNNGSDGSSVINSVIGESAVNTIAKAPILDLDGLDKQRDGPLTGSPKPNGQFDFVKQAPVSENASSKSGEAAVGGDDGSDVSSQINSVIGASHVVGIPAEAA